MSDHEFRMLEDMWKSDEEREVIAKVTVAAQRLGIEIQEAKDALQMSPAQVVAALVGCMVPWAKEAARRSTSAGTDSERGGKDERPGEAGPPADRSTPAGGAARIGEAGHGNVGAGRVSSGDVFRVPDGSERDQEGGVDHREKAEHDDPSLVQAVIEVLNYLDGSGPVEWEWVYEHLSAGLKAADSSSAEGES